MLIVGEMRNGRTRSVAFAGAAIALALVPFTPIGVRVLVAAVVCAVLRAV
ncbi:hypothetical protein BH24ACT6_BH24ACT6_06270 [soil metagenome]